MKNANKIEQATLTELQNILIERIRVACDKKLTKQQQEAETKATILIIATAKQFIAEINAAIRVCELDTLNCEAREKTYDLIGIKTKSKTAKSKKSGKVNEGTVVYACKT